LLESSSVGAPSSLFSAAALPAAEVPAADIAPRIPYIYEC
jgi:hypothetical protein